MYYLGYSLLWQQYQTAHLIFLSLPVSANTHIIAYLSPDGRAHRIEVMYDLLVALKQMKEV